MLNVRDLEKHDTAVAGYCPDQGCHGKRTKRASDACGVGRAEFRSRSGLPGPSDDGTILWLRIIIINNNTPEKRMARPRATGASPKPPDPAAWLAFLLSQVGAHSAGRFADRLAPLGLKPPHAGVLRALDRADGLSQQALGETLGAFPSRLVALLDELEGSGLVERRDRPGDRRCYALHLTDAARALKQIVRVARQHQEDLCAALDESEREQLAGYLRRIAEQQRLVRESIRDGSYWVRAGREQVEAVASCLGLRTRAGSPRPR